MTPLYDAIFDWIETPDWGSSAAYLRAHSELMSDQAIQTLSMLLATAQVSRNTPMAREFLRHYVLLAMARREGIVEAYAQLMGTHSLE